MMVRYLSEDSEEIGFKIFYPVEGVAKNQEFSCGFNTFGLENNISGRAVGIDAIDALLNAMMRVDIFLKSTEECKSGEIRWIGGVEGDDFGLPWESAKPYLK
jgi:hypothetical protein